MECHLQKMNPQAKVNAICHMSVFIHAAFENACAMPKSIYNMGNCICHMFTFIDMLHVLYATSPDPFMIYPLCFVACMKPFMLCLKIHLYASIDS